MIADVKEAEVLCAGPIFALRLNIDLPLAAKSIEIIYESILP